MESEPSGVYEDTLVQMEPIRESAPAIKTVQNKIIVPDSYTWGGRTLPRLPSYEICYDSWEDYSQMLSNRARNNLGRKFDIRAVRGHPPHLRRLSILEEQYKA